MAVWLYSDNEIHGRRLTGTQWSEEDTLTATHGECQLPLAIAADEEGSVHLLWKDRRTGPHEIHYRRWDGQDWGPDEQVAASGTYLVEQALAVGGGRVHVVWVMTPPYRRELHYRYRGDAGWSPELTLNPEHATASNPVIGADSEGRVHVVWEDTRRGGRDLYAIHFLEGQWTPEERLTRLPTQSLEACLAVDAKGTAHLAWSDNRNDYYDVYYRRWTPETGWSAHERLTIDPSDATDPALAVDRSGNAHLVWTDNRDGNREIYYMQRPPDEPWEPNGPGNGARPSVRCLPNPFRAATSIHAYLPAAGDWAVRIFDLQGRLVRTYAVTSSQAGEQILDWGGRTDDDGALPHGFYFVRVSGHGRSASTRVVLTRP
jgi:hypothetical protein